MRTNVTERLPRGPGVRPAHDPPRPRQDHQHRLGQRRCLPAPRSRPTPRRRAQSRNLTKGMATDWAKHGLNCNAIAPGYMRTPLNEPLWSDPAFNEWLERRTPAGRWGSRRSSSARASSSPRTPRRSSTATCSTSTAASRRRSDGRSAVGTPLHREHQPEAPRGRPGTDEATVVAVASRDRSRAEAFAREHGIERALGSYEALLDDPEVEAIYIPLPNSMHVPWSVRALEAGKHVLCEKPLTRRPAEVEAAFAAAERSGRLLVEAFMWRHHPQTQRLRELLDEGVDRPRCGWSARRSRSRCATPATSACSARARRRRADGRRLLLRERLRGWSRAPSRSACSAEQAIGGDGVDVALAGTLRFPDDVLGPVRLRPRGRRTATSSRRSARTARCTSPTRGTAARPGSADARRRRPSAIEIARQPYSHELEDFARAARGEAPPRWAREDALGQARVIEALYASAESGAARYASRERRDRARRRHQRREGAGGLGGRRDRRPRRGRLRALDAAARAGPSRTPRTGGARRSRRSRSSARTTSPASGCRARCTGSSRSTPTSRCCAPRSSGTTSAPARECEEIEERIGLRAADRGHRQPRAHRLHRAEAAVAARARARRLRADRAHPAAQGLRAPAALRRARDRRRRRVRHAAVRRRAPALERRGLPGARDADTGWLPRALESPEVSGETRDGIPVAAGAGDQAAGALGVGVVDAGAPLSVVLGTSGVVFSALPAFAADAEARVHAFCHAVPETWHAMGVMLVRRGRRCAGCATRSAAVDYGELVAEAASWEPGVEGLTFLPYLAGERTPHADPDARGAFTGLSLRHDRGALVRAVLEGVAFGLRDSLDLIAELGAAARPRARVGRRRALGGVAADRRLRARAAARAHRGRRGCRVRRGAARRRRGRPLGLAGRGGARRPCARPARSSRWRSGSSRTARAASASGRCTRR